MKMLLEQTIFGTNFGKYPYLILLMLPGVVSVLLQ